MYLNTLKKTFKTGYTCCFSFTNKPCTLYSRYYDVTKPLTVHATPQWILFKNVISYWWKLCYDITHIWLDWLNVIFSSFQISWSPASGWRTRARSPRRTSTSTSAGTAHTSARRRWRDLRRRTTSAPARPRRRATPAEIEQLCVKAAQRWMDVNMSPTLECLSPHLTASCRCRPVVAVWNKVVFGTVGKIAGFQFEILSV